MPVNRIVNRKADYYIAMYSAHASILESLVGSKGTLKVINIDAGGLKAPYGTFKSIKLFDGLNLVAEKTLHAKVILLDSLNLVSFWTGNLRKDTLERQENLIFTKKVNGENKVTIKKWLTKPMNQHLLVDFSTGSIRSVEETKSSIWNSFKSRLKDLEIEGKDKELRIYAFSPWGCTNFVKEISKLNPKGFLRLYLYSRDVPEKAPLWIDSGKDTERLKIERYTRGTEETFPHFKCIFITAVDDKEQDRLKFAYVGSANLTNAAFFEKDNVEYALFFNDIVTNSEIYKLFNEIRESDYWEERDVPSGQEKDERDDNNKDEETESVNQFKIRELSAEISKRFKSKRGQKRLENAYQKGEELINFPVKGEDSIKKCRIHVEFIKNGIFGLNVEENNLSFDLIIKRHSCKEIHSPDDLNELIEKLVKIEKLRGKKKKKGKRGKSKPTTRKTSPNIGLVNLRFPMIKFLNDKGLISSKISTMDILNKNKNNLPPNKKKLVEIWGKILKQMR
jgi:hypothetical protein